MDDEGQYPYISGMAWTTKGAPLLCPIAPVTLAEMLAREKREMGAGIRAWAGPPSRAVPPGSLRPPAIPAFMGKAPRRRRRALQTDGPGGRALPLGVRTGSILGPAGGL